MIFKILFVASAFLLSFCYSFKNCGFGTPDLPAPKNPASSPTIQKALSDLKSAINDGITSGKFSSNSTSFSVEIFSTHSQTPLFEYYHTAPNLAASNGTKIVDSNSIYRVASVSKLLSVYTFIIETGDKHFHEPVTKYIPELAAASHEYSDSKAADAVDWKSITVGNLASHMSGIGRDYTADLLGNTDLTSSGFPPLNASDFKLCALPSDCDRKKFFENIVKRHPVFPTSTTPIYSNIAFQILGYVLENITGKSFKESLTRSLIFKLKLNGTTYNKPKGNKNGVIPTTGFETMWDLDSPDFVPAGGIYSSSGDLAKIGRSILSSSILTPTQTRRWMKPVSHTALLQFSVGMPWEIGRLQLPAPQNKIIDVYKKLGLLGSYSTDFSLIPGWDMGYVILHADDPTRPTGVSSAIGELINTILLPAVEGAAREEVNAKYTGTYKSSNPKLNSSMIVVTNPDNLGLSVMSLFSNSTDMVNTAAALLGNIPSSDVLITLYPTGLEKEIPGSYGETLQTFRAVFENKATVNPESSFGNCNSWESADSPVYGVVAVDEFAFLVGSDGKAKSAEVRSLRAVLEKVQ
ncbi:hypothetical protein HYALB_00003753 [Hymenoscyphus albidus]|uniref:Beta-lactamase-related domain-containing protein n=1 Tax=Hymenoscyphus albidus TaxID=595503 RepID=A0A9N9LT88_9HELO|nr:hypothetical protein HYALB_00003753 [Hymenoscyphus albidus]